jgi:uncharacterized protein
VSEDTFSPELQEKMAVLEAILDDMGSVLVAYSGGVDSTFLAVMASHVLGDSTLAITAASPVFPSRELEEAKQVAEANGLNHRIIEADPLSVPQLAGNTEDRCYHCKSALLGKLQAIAADAGLAFVADGTNLDDADDYRPGSRAIEEHGVKSPLKESGFTKDDIRRASRVLGLQTADRPSRPCLVTRIPYNEQVTAERLRQIETMENLMSDMGMIIFRARHHGNLLRLELGERENEIAADTANRDKIISCARQQGFEFVTLDMEPYRTGRMNENLDE